MADSGRSVNASYTSGRVVTSGHTDTSSDTIASMGCREMRQLTSLILVLTGICVASCAAKPEVGMGQRTTGQADASEANEPESTEQQLAEERDGFVVAPESPGPLDFRREHSGQWVERDSIRMCDGYLTRLESEEFCSSHVPSDWAPFNFDGETYYVQPLSGSDS